MNLEHEIPPHLLEEVAGSSTIANRTRQKLFLKEMDELIAKPIDRTWRQRWDRQAQEEKEARDKEIRWVEPLNRSHRQS